MSRSPSESSWGAPVNNYPNASSVHNGAHYGVTGQGIVGCHLSGGFQTLGGQVTVNGATLDAGKGAHFLWLIKADQEC
jgi:hypothetical protein